MTKIKIIKGYEEIIRLLFLYILLLFYIIPISLSAQSSTEIVKQDTLIHGSSLSIGNDSILNLCNRNLEAPTMVIDTTQKINYWKITKRTGEIIPTVPDTILTDYFNRTNVEGFGVSEAYLGNLGLATESRVFFERNDRSEFMFMDPFYRYLKTPETFNFINTKIPHSNISYQRAGSRQVMEERLRALLAINIGKKLNLGVDIDYLYSRGYYDSQSAKHLEWVLFGNYLSDRHQLHLFLSPKTDYTTAENGGVQNDRMITHPEGVNSRDIPTNLRNTWNNMKGSRYFLNYHYNLGFTKDTELTDEDGNIVKEFIPVSSIIYTMNYENRKKRFYTDSENDVNNFYENTYGVIEDNFSETYAVNDSTSYWSFSNTFGLSLREGFAEWAKFDLTAFLTQDFRSFNLMDRNNLTYEANQSSTYVGGELAKRKGDILRYNAQASFGVLGYNLGDMNLSGNIQARIPLLGDTTIMNAYGSVKNLAPTFYENNYRSKYFWWENDFSKIKKVHIGGEIEIPHTKTQVGLGVENITNYIYFGVNGKPVQHDGNIQILSARLKQNIHYKALHWDNQLVYQTSSAQNILPLPDLAAYSSLYVEFKIAKVLTVQMGVNAHYWTKYYAPSYEPATQQFRLQNPDNAVKVGHYPLINGFINCHLKQARFFLEYYNASSMFITPTEYFSLPHYPVNPTSVKLGLSVDFIN